MSVSFSVTIQEEEVLYDGEVTVDELATFHLGNHTVLRCIINNNRKDSYGEMTVSLDVFATWMEACAPRRPNSIWFAASLFARELEFSHKESTTLQAVISWG